MNDAIIEKSLFIVLENKETHELKFLRNYNEKQPIRATKSIFNKIINQQSDKYQDYHVHLVEVYLVESTEYEDDDES